jgi:hypothetical protein
VSCDVYILWRCGGVYITRAAWLPTSYDCLVMCDYNDW